MAFQAYPKDPKELSNEMFKAAYSSLGSLPCPIDTNLLMDIMPEIPARKTHESVNLENQVLMRRPWGVS